MVENGYHPLITAAIVVRDWTVSTKATGNFHVAVGVFVERVRSTGRREPLEIQTPYYPLDCLYRWACMVSHLGELAPQTRSGAPVRRFSLQTIIRHQAD